MSYRQKEDERVLCNACPICFVLPSFLKGQKVSEGNNLVLTSSKKRPKYLPNVDIASSGQNQANLSYVFWKI